jgi:hypothetical protein
VTRCLGGNAEPAEGTVEESNRAKKTHPEPFSRIVAHRQHKKRLGGPEHLPEDSDRGRKGAKGRALSMESPPCWSWVVPSHQQPTAV